jgi:hypothetical protein
MTNDARSLTPVRSVTTSVELAPEMAQELLAVFAEYGFSAKYGSSPQGLGPPSIDSTSIDVAATAFLTTFVTLFARDAYAKLKEFVIEAYRRPRADRRGETRPAAFLIRDDWFSMGREVKITLELDLPDKAYEALFAVDIASLSSTWLRWNREEHRWIAEPVSGHSVVGAGDEYQLSVISVSRRISTADQIKALRSHTHDGWEVVAMEESEVARFYWVRRYRPGTGTGPDELKKLVIPRRDLGPPTQ